MQVGLRVLRHFLLLRRQCIMLRHGVCYSRGKNMFSWIDVHKHTLSMGICKRFYKYKLAKILLEEVSITIFGENVVGRDVPTMKAKQDRFSDFTWSCFGFHDYSLIEMCCNAFSQSCWYRLSSVWQYQWPTHIKQNQLVHCLLLLCKYKIIHLQSHIGQENLRHIFC